MVLERQRKQPLYKQIVNYILNKIKDDTYQVGEAIPTENELCNKFDVSRNTVRKGIDELIQKGYLYRVQGSGTFVFSKDDSKQQNNNKIGVVLPSCNYPLHADYLYGIEKAADKRNYRVTFINSHSDSKKQDEGIQKLINEGISGLIILPVPQPEDSNSIIDLKKQKYPFVLIDRKLKGCKTNFVGSDNLAGAYQATEYLIELGHKHIGFATGDYYLVTSLKDRVNGYKEALNNNGIDYNEQYIFSYAKKEKEEKLYSIFKNFIKKFKGTAIIAASDELAIFIIKMCRQENILVPKDLSVIGFDNLDVGQHLEKPLTTVRQFPEEIGTLAVDLLIEGINKEEKKEITKEINYPMELIVRKSCDKIN